MQMVRKKSMITQMSYEYITEYSYGVGESLNLIAPKLFGGSNSEDLGSIHRCTNL